jgi:hypothetical protein
MTDFSDITSYATVKLWTGAVASDPIAARLRRREQKVLADFCAHTGKDPDALIAESTSERDTKNDYMRTLKRWVPTYATDERARHEAENAVRSFFMANGLRVITKPFADVYRKSDD